MKGAPSLYRGYLLPHEIISHSVWPDYWFSLSFRDVGGLLATRNGDVSLRGDSPMVQDDWQRASTPTQGQKSRDGDYWYLAEMFARIQGCQMCLWRVGDQDGDVLDSLVQPQRDQHAAKRFFRKLLRGKGCGPSAW